MFSCPRRSEISRIENPKAVGEAIAKGVCEAYGVKYAAPSFRLVKSDVFYRVQVGAHNDRYNAEIFLAQVKKAGFTNAFIVEVKK